MVFTLTYQHIFTIIYALITLIWYKIYINYTIDHCVVIDFQEHLSKEDFMFVRLKTSNESFDNWIYTKEQKYFDSIKMNRKLLCFIYGDKIGLSWNDLTNTTLYYIKLVALIILYIFVIIINININSSASQTFYRI